MTCLEIARIHHRAALEAADRERMFRLRFGEDAVSAIYRGVKRRAVVKTLKALELCSATPTLPGLRAHALLSVIKGKGW